MSAITNSPALFPQCQSPSPGTFYAFNLPASGHDTMPSTSSFRAARIFTLFTLLAAMVHAAPPAGEAAAPLQKRAVTYEGCYSSSTPLTSDGSYPYQSSGYCGDQCSGSAVYAMTGGSDCWCGDQLPALDDKVDKSECDTSCTGFPSDICTCRVMMGIMRRD